MLVRVTTDNHIRGGENLASDVEASVESALKRFGTQVTRVEVHLADENSHKRGDNDKKCTLEARLSGLQPVAATGAGANLDQAINDALDNLVAVLERKLGRLGERKGRPAYGVETAD